MKTFKVSDLEEFLEQRKAPQSMCNGIMRQAKAIAVKGGFSETDLGSLLGETALRDDFARNAGKLPPVLPWLHMKFPVPPPSRGALRAQRR